MVKPVEGKKPDGVVGAAAGSAVLSIFYVLICQMDCYIGTPAIALPGWDWTLDELINLTAI